MDPCRPKKQSTRHRRPQIDLPKNPGDSTPQPSGTHTMRLRNPLQRRIEELEAALLPKGRLFTMFVIDCKVPDHEAQGTTSIANDNSDPINQNFDVIAAARGCRISPAQADHLVCQRVWQDCRTLPPQLTWTVSHQRRACGRPRLWLFLRDPATPVGGGWWIWS